MLILSDMVGKFAMHNARNVTCVRYIPSVRMLEALTRKILLYQVRYI
jgi:hypothetical protein